MSDKEITFENLYAPFTRPKYYGQKYLNADSEDKLLLMLGEACSVSAFSLVHILKLPKRGSFVLALSKKVIPQKYQHHQFLYNFSFSHCLIYVVRKLNEVLKRELTEEDADKFFSTVYAYGGSYFSAANKYSEDDKAQLLTEMKQRLKDYDKCQIIEENILLENILNGLESKVSPKQIAIFFKEANTLLSLIEPLHFIDRLKIIRGEKVVRREGN